MTFVCMRIAQILTLIPTMGMLAYFVNVFVSRNALTPDAILILFITSVLALAWSVLTLFSYHRSAANARFVALVDLAVFGTLIAAVYTLRAIADADCRADPPPSKRWTALVPVPAGAGPREDGGAWRADRPCAMLKACWAFAIINIILFFVTAVAAFTHGDQLSASYYYRDETRYRSRSRSHGHHHSHHHHRHHHAPRRQSSRHRHHHRRSHSGHRSPPDYVRRVYV
ncbi:hypothetical protein CDD81_8045 [Ophiocordyceps australis]|uniref:MARVEL domain-containing protein n=1 Tax=Ophiocordyceps australis TaxID=1399860 RepID=A0A2C5Y2R6_9HYPO|nr:hypothetical protein CDD81_8045 [Ophiocordyceps australis]